MSTSAPRIRATHFVTKGQIATLEKLWGETEWIKLLKATGFSYRQLQAMRERQMDRNLERLMYENLFDPSSLDR